MNHVQNTQITDERDDALSSEEVVVFDQDTVSTPGLVDHRPGFRARGRPLVAAEAASVDPEKSQST